MSALAPTLEAFFTERLIGQRHASPNTVAAYRDAWRLVLRFVCGRTGKQPCQLDLVDLDAPLIGVFLDHLEADRHNSARTRNARLAAIRSFFRYAALRHPEHAALIARVLAIPAKRCEKAEVSYLDEAEADALVAAPDRDTWTGRRDHALLDVAIQTGLRVSELTGVRNQDVECGHRCPHSLHGQGQEATVHAVVQGHRQGPAGLDERTPRRARRFPLPHPPRHTAHPWCGGMSHHQTRHRRRAAMPVHPHQAVHSPCPQTHLRDAAVAIGG